MSFEWAKALVTEELLHNSIVYANKTTKRKCRFMLLLYLFDYWIENWMSLWHERAEDGKEESKVSVWRAEGIIRYVNKGKLREPYVHISLVWQSEF